jgi:hypothetical protein
MADLNVRIYIITNIVAILVIMDVKTFNTDIIVFIDNIVTVLVVDIFLY